MYTKQKTLYFTLKLKNLFHCNLCNHNHSKLDKNLSDENILAIITAITKVLARQK